MKYFSKSEEAAVVDTIVVNITRTVLLVEVTGIGTNIITVIAVIKIVIEIVEVITPDIIIATVNTPAAVQERKASLFTV